MALKVTIRNPYELLNDIASLYESTARVFMEYIDNSFDSAADLKEEYSSKTGKNIFPYEILISIEVDTLNKSVRFIDNCLGMSPIKMRDLVENINKSEKKARPWTNGKFGYGAQAFRACCNQMTVISKQQNKPIYQLDIPRAAAEVANEKQLSSNALKYSSGTSIILKGFDKEAWNELSPEDLKRETEKHFEGVLREQNITVQVIWNKNEETCRAFDYDSILGEKIEEDVTSLVTPSKSKKNGPITSVLLKPIKIYFKTTKNVIPNKRPIFMNKGRRIGEIEFVNSYIRNKSIYKTGLWGNNNLIGYIELNDNLDPVLIRNDFKRTQARQAFYDYLSNMEAKLWAELRNLNRISSDSGFNKFEEALSGILKQFAKEDGMKFTSQFIEGGNRKLKEDNQGDIKTKKKIILDIKDTGNKGKQIPKGDGVETLAELSLEDEMGVKPSPKSGLNVHFDRINDPPFDSVNNKQLRSQCPGNAGEITIYANHPNFKERIGENRQKELVLTPRLVSYIASEVSIWYKKMYYDKYKLEPVVKDIMGSIEKTLTDQTEFVYKLEGLLQPFTDKSLTSLE